MIGLIVVGLAAPVWADTKNGNANASSWQRWRFTSLGDVDDDGDDARWGSHRRAEAPLIQRLEKGVR